MMKDTPARPIFKKLLDALEGYADLIREADRCFDEPEPEKAEPNVCQFWEDP